MQSACFSCGTPVDTFRAVARIVEAKVVSLCDGCARGDRLRRVSQSPPVAPVAVAPARTSPRRRPPPDIRQVVHVGLATCVVIGVAGAFVDSSSASSSALPTLSLPSAPALVVDEVPLPAPHRAEDWGPDLAADEAPIVHPLPGPERLLPGRGSRHFGADRDGRGKALGCGRGHCGVDIGERIGTPILAIRDGVVSKVVRYDNEHGGLMVTIDHPDGLTSQYFHLKDIRDDLRAGDRVVAGEGIATLGRSGIKHSPAHLHFSLLRRDGDVTERGDYLDPLPYLEDAVVVAEPVVASR